MHPSPRCAFARLAVVSGAVSSLFLASSVQVSALEPPAPVVDDRPATVAPSHAFHHHHLAIFAGAVAENGQIHAADGLDYEYRPTQYLGAVAFAENSIARDITWVAGLGLGIHPYAGCKIVVAPAIERRLGHNAFLARVGAAYDFDLGPLVLTPTAAADYVHQHVATVFGLDVGFGF